MKSSLRFILPLIMSVVIVSVIFAAYQARTEGRNLRRELERRATLLAESLQESVEPVVERAGPATSLEHVVDRFGHREHLVGIAVYDSNGKLMAMSSGLGDEFDDAPDVAENADSAGKGEGVYTSLAETPMYIWALPLRRRGDVIATLVLYNDTSYIELTTTRIWRDTLLDALLESFFIVALALILIRWTFVRPMARTAQWMRSLRSGKLAPPPPELKGDAILKELTHEAARLARNLGAAQAAAEEEARLRANAEALWTEERLRVSMRAKMEGGSLFVISNREPFAHVRREGGGIEVMEPASGLVTALSPVLMATEGTWIAHGSGSADRETVDDHDRLRVPPDAPRYTLRRVWLSKEEEDGYYFGFANEGLWPLCHIAHTRPIFRPSDWEYYQEVNRRFANAALEEMEGVAHPIVLVQDYHFALLPRYIKEARPDARVAIFWHIPWPNPEVFSICPWYRELLDGLLGADLIGFHIQSHCNNFLETVDRAIESLTNWDTFSVNRHQHVTYVRAFPISVAFPDSSADIRPQLTTGEERYALLKALGIEAAFLGVGVDRVDYTKGIVERFRGIERFLEEFPQYQRQFTFVEIGAPSRTHIRRYQNLELEVAQEAERINQRFQAGRWKPIVFLNRHHSHQEIDRYYRAADFCMVTSLHDGMNLVAKEFIASRSDESGVLILSMFAGAVRELPDALLVNPYDVEQLAQAIHTALEMSPEERTDRMQRMRRVVRERNVYRWAGNLLLDLCELRIDKLDRVEAL
jgi:trehalose-6-phosphate synthase